MKWFLKKLLAVCTKLSGMLKKKKKKHFFFQLTPFANRVYGFHVRTIPPPLIPIQTWPVG